MNEQKSNDLIEKKIKQESEDFYENVKEEPLDGEYFEEVVPKLEHVINMQTPSTSLLPAQCLYFPQIKQNVSKDIITSFSPQNVAHCNSDVNDFATEVKLEGQSLSFNQFKKEIMQEAESLLEKVKEEPLDGENFTKSVPNFRELVEPWLRSNSHFFDTSNDEISDNSSQIFKQEPVCSEAKSALALDDVKMEPIDELDGDLGSQMHVDPKIFEEPIQKQHYRRCLVCSELKPMKFIKVVALVQDKLIIMIKLVLCGEYNLASAQSFVCEKKRVPICYAHFSEAFNEFCSVLRIQKLNEMHSCPPELMQNLMRTVNAFYPQLSALDFLIILKIFIRKNQNSLRMAEENQSRIDQVNEPSTHLMLHQNLYLNNTQPIQEISSSSLQEFPIDDVNNDEKENDYIVSEMNTSKNNTIMITDGKSQNKMMNPDSKKFNARCSVCFELKNRELWKTVLLVQDKLIIMIKLVLCGECTLAKAKSFMSRKKRVPICHVHFSEALNEIYSALGIQKSEINYSCSLELMHNLMVTVNAFRPKLSAMDFCNILKNFTTRNRHILPMVHMEIKHEIQKLLNLISDENKSRCATGSSEAKSYRCAVCARTKPVNELRGVTSREYKLMYMIGCILCGKYTIKEAHSVLYRANVRYFCQIHFFQTIDEIYNALSIKHYDEFGFCSAEKMNNLMIIVNYLIPGFETWQFHNSLEKFVNSQKNLVRMD